MTTTPGTIIPVHMIARLDDGTIMQTPQWIAVWDEEPIDTMTAHATITLMVPDPKHPSRLVPSMGAQQAIFAHGSYVVSDCLRYALDLDRDRSEYAPIDPKSNSTEIMRNAFARDVRRAGGERLTSAEVSTRLDVQPSTWRSWVSRDQAPKPDGAYDARTPYWLASTIDEWKASRPRAK